MTILGISLITSGLGLVCAGLIIWGREERIDPAAVERAGPHEFRVVLDGLQDGDRRSESPDLVPEPATEAASALLNPFAALARAQANSGAAASVEPAN